MKNTYKGKVYAVIMAILVVVALTSKPYIQKLEDIDTWANTNNILSVYIAKWRCIMNGYGIANALLTISLAYVIYRVVLYIGGFKFKKKKSEIILALFFSFCMIVGQAFQSTNSLDCVYGGFFYCSVSLIRSIGYFILFYLCILFLEKYLGNRRSDIGNCSGLTKFVFDKHPLVVPFIIIFICWLPYLIACYPGVVQWDGLRQLKNAMDLSSSDNSHPVFTTLLMGLAMKIGRFFGNDNLGIFFYVFPQMIIAALVTAENFVQFKKMKTSFAIRWITLLYFSLISLWPLYAVSEFKDTLFYIVFLAFTIKLVNAFMDAESFWKNYKNLGLLIIYMTLLELIRPNGIYIVVLSMVLIIFAGWNGIKNYRGWLCLVLAVVIYFIFNKCIVPALGVEPGRVQEAFCVPFQQTARYVNEYDDEITVEEKSIISAVLDYDVLLNEYNPEFADPVKNSYNTNATSEDLIAYFKLWFKQFLKHPGVYFEATLNGTYGYYYPNKTEYREGLGAYSITYDERIYTGEVDIYMNSDMETARDILENTSYIVRNIPLVGFVFSNGIYTWILLLCALLLAKLKGIRYVAPCIPAFIVILFCIVSPVNAYIRYMRPAMVVTPLIIAYTVFVCGSNIDLHKTNDEIDKEIIV
jgi:hypothetical protein